MHLRARWYNPATATLLSRDPFAGFAEQPYSLNPYQYAYANPVLLTDPSGQSPVLLAGAALIVVGGVIVSLGQAGALAPISPEAQRLYDDAAEGLEDVIGGAADAAVSTGLRSLFTLGNWAWEQEGFSLDPSLSGWGAMVFVLGGVSCYLRTDQFAFDTPSISDLFVAGPMLVELWHYLTTATPLETLPPDNISFADLPYRNGRGKTSGYLVDAQGNRISQIYESGNNPYSNDTGLVRGDDRIYTIQDHVEAQIAGWMRDNNVFEATLVLNNHPCSNGVNNCQNLLPRMLPPSAKLRVIVPDGFDARGPFDQVFIGVH